MKTIKRQVWDKIQFNTCSWADNPILEWIIVENEYWMKFADVNWVLYELSRLMNINLVNYI